MTVLEYEASRKLELAALEIREQTGANPFYSLLGAALRQADTTNFDMIQHNWPLFVHEMKARYKAPGGILESDP